MSFIRSSKFRHVFGKAAKKDQCYDAIRISRISWDSNFCAVNPKFVAVITESGGGSSFVVIPLAKVGRLDINAPHVSAHKGPVYDIAWCPHNDNMIASCSDDCTIKLWDIPEDGLVESMTEPLLTLAGHQRRVTSVLWHPSAQNVLVSASSDNTILIWNLETGEPVTEIPVPDQIFCMSFSEDGSLLACTCKDKNLRIIDSHTGAILMETQAHAGHKSPQCVFLKDNKVFTTGVSKMSERQYALWDLTSGSLELMVREEVDPSNGVLFIFYDPDCNIIYLVGKGHPYVSHWNSSDEYKNMMKLSSDETKVKQCPNPIQFILNKPQQFGKGDCQIRYFEITSEAPYVHYLTQYSTTSPQKGCGFMPKRGLDCNHNEIARFYKLHNNGLCETTTFTVPRKSELFQSDLYPDTASIEPAITADEFFAGKNAPTKKMQFKQTDKAPTTTVKKETALGGLRKSTAVSSRDSTVQKTSSNGAAEAAAPSLAASALPPKKAVESAPAVSSEDMSELKKEIEELKKLVGQQDKRIETLEGRLAHMEQSNHTDEEEEEEAA